MSEAMSDAELLGRIRSDEPGAFEALVDRFGDQIFGFGLRMCGEREDAKDVFQETMLQAYRKLQKLENPEALKSWLYRVASNACLMKRRRSKFAPSRELSLEELKPRRGEGREVEIADPGELPDEEVVQAQLREILHEAIRDLPEAYRIVLVMRDLEHLSTRDVAEALDLSETAVKMRLHRARLIVRQIVEKRLVARGEGSGP